MYKNWSQKVSATWNRIRCYSVMNHARMVDRNYKIWMYMGI